MLPLLLAFFCSVSELPTVPMPNIVPADPPIVIRHDKADSAYINLGKTFPSVAKVGKRGGDGTLIAPQWILTAAHVAEGMYRRKGADLKIYFNKDESGLPIDKIFIHPDFGNQQGADIALIKLKFPMEAIEPAQLYSQTDEVGQEIIIVGHGDVKNGQGGEWKVDGIKRGATNKIDEVEETRIVFDFDEPSAGTELEGTAGRGDSGGPAFIITNGIPYVAGISSMGRPGKNGPGTYGAVEYYTRVSHYIDWLNQTMADPGKSRSLADSPLAQKNSNERRQDHRGNVVVRRGGKSDVVKGLGLMLRQENDKIRIGGKADPLVPIAFREVMFRPPSFLESLNGVSYRSLERFKADFAKIKPGEAFNIQFTIQGKLSTYKGIKL